MVQAQRATVLPQRFSRSHADLCVLRDDMFARCRQTAVSLASATLIRLWCGFKAIESLQNIAATRSVPWSLLKLSRLHRCLFCKFGVDSERYNRCNRRLIASTVYAAAIHSIVVNSANLVWIQSDIIAVKKRLIASTVYAAAIHSLPFWTKPRAVPIRRANPTPPCCS